MEEAANASSFGLGCQSCGWEFGTVPHDKQVLCKLGIPRFFRSQWGTEMPPGHTSHPDLHVTRAPPQPWLCRPIALGPPGRGSAAQTTGLASIRPEQRPRRRLHTLPRAPKSTHILPPAPQQILLQCPGSLLPPEGRKGHPDPNIPCGFKV